MKWYWLTPINLRPKAFMMRVYILATVLFLTVLPGSVSHAGQDVSAEGTGLITLTMRVDSSCAHLMERNTAQTQEADQVRYRVLAKLGETTTTLSATARVGNHLYSADSATIAAIPALKGLVGTKPLTNAAAPGSSTALLSHDARSGAISIVITTVLNFNAQIDQLATQLGVDRQAALLSINKMLEASGSKIGGDGLMTDDHSMPLGIAEGSWKAYLRGERTVFEMPAAEMAPFIAKEQAANNSAITGMFQMLGTLVQSMGVPLSINVASAPGTAAAKPHQFIAEGMMLDSPLRLISSNGEITMTGPLDFIEFVVDQVRTTAPGGVTSQTLGVAAPTPSGQEEN